jgi:hypothetical protein
MNRIKRVLLVDWDAIAGILAAVAAVVLHFLHFTEIDVLLTISTVLVAVLFIRHLRLERTFEKADTLIRGIHETVFPLAVKVESVQSDLLEIRASRGKPSVRVYGSRQQVYAAIAAVLDELNKAPGEKQLALGALHGHSGERVIDESDVQQEFKAFDEAMRKCIQEPGSRWRVRHVYNITTEERLQLIEQRLKDTALADGFEVRAFSQRQGIPQLATLVAGSEDLFIAIGDPRYYRVQKAIHVRSRGAVEIAMQYFDRVWESDDILVLRTGDRVNADGIEELRGLIKERATGSNKRVNLPAGAAPLG